MNAIVVTEIVLRQMRRDGWYDYSHTDSDGHAPCRFENPQPHDINNGNCEDWAMKARELFGGEIAWLDTFKTYADWAHCVLRVDGHYYDSIHPDGARTLKEFTKQAKDYFQRLRLATITTNNEGA